MEQNAPIRGLESHSNYNVELPYSEVMQAGKTSWPQLKIPLTASLIASSSDARAVSPRGISISEDETIEQGQQWLKSTRTQ
jgi:hypothetical protein